MCNGWEVAEETKIAVCIDEEGKETHKVAQLCGVPSPVRHKTTALSNDTRKRQFLRY
jgi:hypothetical protein